MMPSVTCLRLSDVSVIYHVTYFQFPIKSAFLLYIGRQAAAAAPALRHTIGFDTQYRTLDIGRCRKFGQVPFLCRTYIPGERL